MATSSFKKIQQIFHFSSTKKANEESFLDSSPRIEINPASDPIDHIIEEADPPLSSSPPPLSSSPPPIPSPNIEDIPESSSGPSSAIFNNNSTQKIETRPQQTSSTNNKPSYEMNMVDKIQIGKKFQLSMEEISTLTTASLRADLISLEIRLMDISPLELRTRIEPLFDLDPMLHSTNPSRNRKSLDRRISFSRPPSSSSGVFVLPQTPSIDSIDVSHVSISSRSKSIDKGINHSIQNSPIVAKQLFPAESIETNSKLSKQEERDLQRKKLSQQSEPTWKSSNTRTQTGISKSSQKPDSKHPSTNDEKVEKKKTEKPSLYSVARALRSNTSNSSSKDSSHSVALETAAQKAAAIFTSRISKKTSKGMDDDSSQSSTIKRPISSESKRTPISSQIHKTPGSSTIQKNKTPTSTVRSSMTNLTSTPSHLSSTTSSASKNVQRSGSGSSATTLRRSVDTTSSTTSSSTSTYHSNLQSTTIKATGGHQFKPKSVTVSNNSTTHQQPSIPPPTLRGGGGGTRSSKLENSSSSNPATSTEMNTTTQRKTSERSKPSISVSTLQANKIGKTDRQLKHMSSSLSTVSDGGTNKLQSTTTTSSSSSQSSIPVSNEKIIQSSEPAINPFGALITKTPPRDV